MPTDSEVFSAIAQTRTGILSDLIGRSGADLNGLEVVRRPQRVRVMMRLRDSVDAAAFNLGDVLATETEVELRGRRSAMLVLGDDPARALLGAVVLAIWHAVPGARGAISAALAEETAKRAEQAGRLWSAVAETRVDFEGGAIEAYSAADRTKGR